MSSPTGSGSRGVSRRRFLRAASLGPVSLGMGALWSGCTLTAARGQGVLGSNDALRLGVIGLNGRGAALANAFRKVPGVRIAALCDCDRAVLDRRMAEAQQRDERPQGFSDPRRLLASGTVDAVAIATPNHWHALLGVWACEHGLDAYVEKPVSHDLWEGAQLCAAAHRHGRVVASGMQSRSNPGMRAAIEYLQGGALGRVRLARGLCYKRRKSIGSIAAPAEPPASVDYDVWLGPAPEQPVRRGSFHYDWHWQWDFGNGDLGNQGVHQMDLLRWGLGQDALPERVWSLGGRLGYEDDGETPNTQLVWLDYRPAPLLFEVRGLPHRPGADAMDQFLGTRIGVVFHCEQGCLVLDSYEGGHALDPDGARIAEFAGDGDHCAGFVAAVRARDPGLLTADARQGHLSAALCHLGNDSLRAGTARSNAEVGAGVRWLPELSEAWERMREHLAANGLDRDATPLLLGRMLAPAAMQHAPRAYRAPYVLEPQA